MPKKLEAHEVCARITRAQRSILKIQEDTASTHLRSAAHLAYLALSATWWVSLAEADPEGPEDTLRRITYARECIQDLRAAIERTDDRLMEEEARIRRAA